jgi:hypothetical protein
MAKQGLEIKHRTRRWEMDASWLAPRLHRVAGHALYGHRNPLENQNKDDPSGDTILNPSNKNQRLYTIF